MKNKLFTTFFGVAVFFLIITVSIGLPIYLRFFYYLHINALSLPQRTGYDFETIKQAYDQVLNYLTLPFTSFGVGVFKYTEEGASHFKDCKQLFNLNIIVMLLSLSFIIFCLVLKKKKKISILKPCGFSPAFFSAVCVLSVFIILAVVVAVDFNSAFIVFHKLFFAGKDNWTFDPRYDEIIKILPQEFFLNCAVFIVSGIILISVVIIILSAVKRVKLKKRQEI